MRSAWRLAVAAVLITVSTAWTGIEWNGGSIQWFPYQQGVLTARTQKKPMCLVIYTEWCPHCRAYSNVFRDPHVIAMSRHFVMVHVDADQEPGVARQHAPEGNSIPRTFFLSSAGVPNLALTSGGKNKYVYSESDPASLLNGMQRAAASLH